MTSSQWTMAIHLAGAVLCLAALALNATVIHEPAAQQAVIAIVAGLWGKYGFAPAGPILDRLVERMSPERVERVRSHRPPPMSVDPERLPTAPPPAGRAP